MPTELEELLDFISHGNAQIRKIAVENLVSYSLSQPAIFRTKQFLPIEDLKLLVLDYQKIAQDALNILINLSTDEEILENLVSDHTFVTTLLNRVANLSEPNANEISMLLANLAKHDELKEIVFSDLPALKELESGSKAVNQLVDLFVKGADGTYNSSANYDYLSYLFADLAKYADARSYFLTRQSYDHIFPLCKIMVFTSHGSHIRRRGVASALKNVCFETNKHQSLLAEDEIGILPYLLLPLMGNEEYKDKDMDGMLEECQFLAPNKKRDSDSEIIKTHLESLMLLTATRQGRDRLRAIKLYPIVRECHLGVEDEEVREACERLVQVLMRDEEGEEASGNIKNVVIRRINAVGKNNGDFKNLPAAATSGHWAMQDISEDQDHEIVEV